MIGVARASPCHQPEPHSLIMVLNRGMEEVLILAVGGGFNLKVRVVFRTIMQRACSLLCWPVLDGALSWIPFFTGLSNEVHFPRSQQGIAVNVCFSDGETRAVCVKQEQTCEFIAPNGSPTMVASTEAVTVSDVPKGSFTFNIGVSRRLPRLDAYFQSAIPNSVVVLHKSHHLPFARQTCVETILEQQLFSLTGENPEPGKKQNPRYELTVRIMNLLTRPKAATKLV